MTAEWNVGYEPMIPCIIQASSGREVVSEALVDTGAEIILLDAGLAAILEIDLESGDTIQVVGLGAAYQAIKFAPIQFALLYRPELTVSVNAGFVPGLAADFHNLLGLDVLSQVDLRLSHRRRQLSLAMTP
jgi:hypothetical protein